MTITKIKIIWPVLIIVIFVLFGGNMASYYFSHFFNKDSKSGLDYSGKNDTSAENKAEVFSLVSSNKTVKGMSIEKYNSEGEIAVLETTGAIFKINFNKGLIEIQQKIGKNRSVAKIYITDGQFKKNNILDKNGFDYVWRDEVDKSLKMIISGDSVIRLFNIKKLEARLEFIPIHAQLSTSKWEFKNNGLLALDDWGGIAIMPPSYANNEKWPKDFDNNVWKLSGDEALPILFIGILPPRFFDWERSFMPIVHYSSHIQRYPTDEQIADYSKYAKVLEMHSWVWQNRYDPDEKDENGSKRPLWDDYSYLPQNGKWIPDDEKELKRVVSTAHKYNMKFVPYIALQLNFGGLDSQIKEIKRLKDIYGIDGIYIDGIFLEEYPEASYVAAREIRQLFGDDGWLTLHTSHASGYWAPFISSYMDFIVTSEHDSFNRWISTSYNISNSIASIWPEIPLDTKDGKEFLKKIVDDSLKLNNRVLFMTGENGQWRDWRLYFTPDEMDFVKKYYLNALEKIKNNTLR